MTGLLRSLHRVRFPWLPAVGLLFTLSLLAVELLPVGGGTTAVVVAGFGTVTAVLAAGFARTLFS